MSSKKPSEDFADLFSARLSTDESNNAPLAERLRPNTLDGFVGQEQVVGTGTPFRAAIENDQLVSVILWGPPGSGKTTLAHIIAETTSCFFVSLSAVTSGVPALRKIIGDAQERRKFQRQRTILFVDEIHRFNKAQQDAFLPYVENGTIILIGATTENPSFEVNSPLLSRSTVYVLEPLSQDNLRLIIGKALSDKNRGLGQFNVTIPPDAMERLLEAAHGDARVALNILELAFFSTRQGREARIGTATISAVLQQRMPKYDKHGEEHYNIISALHKSMRDSDPQAATYWLARMLEGGEYPLYIARRLVRFASEDVGNADPQALQIAVAAMQAVHFVGMPEASLALAQAVTYLACAPKSNAVYQAYTQASDDARMTGHLPVPLVMRNAPTQLMREVGYGAGYKYAHNFHDATISQRHLPPELEHRIYYEPTNRGFEKQIQERMLARDAGRRKTLEGQEDLP